VVGGGCGPPFVFLWVVCIQTVEFLN